LLVQAKLPLDDAEADTQHYDDDHADIGRFGAASSKVIVLICHSLVLCLP
jgi:histone-binding protein RBBP4